MPSHAASPPLTVTVVAALWVTWGRCGASGSPGAGCDNGKLSLDMDLPVDPVSWGCPVSTWSTQTRPSIDTVHDPDPARQICMNQSISYNTTIPNSGAYRPVRAESGEYLYCPPQRWLNNVHQGATALLYHPCAPRHEHRLLSALGRSCLPHYILTAHPQLSKHMPIALVSWGRTLELSTMASLDVCDWLETMATSTRNKIVGGASQGRKYNFLLTWSTERHQHPGEHTVSNQESLRRCCERTISPMLNGGMKAEPETHMKRESSKQTRDEGKSRQIRAAIVDKLQNLKGNEKQNTAMPTRTTPSRTGEADSANYPPGNRTFSKLAGQVELLSQAKSLTSRPQTPSGSNASEAKDSVGFRAPAQQPNTDHTDVRNPKPSVVSDPESDHTTRPKALTQSSKDSKKTEKEKSMKNNNPKDTTANIMKDQQELDVKERELEHKQKHSDAHSYQNSEKTGDNSVSKSKSESPQRSTQSATNQPNSHDCDGCTEGQHCDCNKDSGAKARAVLVNQALPRTPRTDEAVWAAAALGFLLVLLTLSVLHTRLYRHWRTTPSLYWHDPEQDYDSVADVIRRRLQISKRRRKRSRRKECVLLPSSSSSDDDP